jgi:GDPmannose 4,6-dehydratase
MTHALIVGSAGQDGQLLFAQLAQSGASVLGISRTAIRTAGSIPAALPATIDILDPLQVARAVEVFAPDEVYYLAAFHHAAEDPALSRPAALYQRSFDVHVRGLLHFLDALRDHAPRARLFYAASSHVFGNPPTPVQDELTPLNPHCIYGITKTAGVHCCRFYRRTYGLYAAAGFLYNHESNLRPANFLSQKIIRAAVAIRRGVQDTLALADLSPVLDWGYAPDYVRAMSEILRLEEPTDLIVATGIPHTVRDFVTAAFLEAGVDPAGRVVEDPAIVVKQRAHLIGNPAALHRLTPWRPTVDFAGMIGIMVRQEARRQGLSL